MLELLRDPDLPVLVQGATGRASGRHVALMRQYGTRIVAAVSARHAGGEVEGVPIFASCAEAVRATGARASLVMLPPQAVLEAVGEAVSAGLKLVVTIAEGVPVHDALRIARLTRDAGVTWVGACTPGIAIPGRMKLGFLPDASLRPGPLGMMSKSGTLSYEIGRRLAQVGLGQSLWVGVGGDPVKGVRFADLLPVFEADPATRAMVVIGEIGGTEEEELANAMRLAPGKPVYVLIAGSAAPEGVTMGHAGALIHGAFGSVAGKTAALQAAGAAVFRTMDAMVATIQADAGAWREAADSHAWRDATASNEEGSE